MDDSLTTKLLVAALVICVILFFVEIGRQLLGTDDEPTV